MIFLVTEVSQNKIYDGTQNNELVSMFMKLFIYIYLEEKQCKSSNKRQQNVKQKL